jgi:3'-phosphoadenosine 5'-phosphosulfate sulfotransferase (PAPS reductase)/FAD synthetase
MLYHILEAFGGTLPADVKVVFCNTGKERPETLDFVERCSQRWGVPVVWLEYRRNGSLPVQKKGRNGQPSIGRHDFAVVDYQTASRDGEPFDALLLTLAEFRREVKDADPLLPNPVQRSCTGEMKVRTLGRYLTALGWDLGGVTDAIGLRADEPRRLAKLAARTAGKVGVLECGNPVTPLGKDGVTEADVMRFWSEQPFDLELMQHEGNCDLCFLKSERKLLDILARRPDLGRWWADREAQTGQRFRKDRNPYSVLIAESKLADLFTMAEDPDDLSISCHCTD